MIQVFRDTDELLTAAAGFFVQTARQAMADRGAFNVALSGGSSPKKLYEKLASQTYRDQVDWSKVYFFFGDERYVPADDPDSNALMAKKTLFNPLNIPESQIFQVNTALPPSEAAEDYIQRIKAHFKTDVIHFDLILLGLGDNSHTASLFPNTPVLQDQSKSVKAVFLEEQQVYRITLTAPLINQAHEIVFLVYGAAKAEAVRHVLEGEQDIENYPAQLIHPAQGNLHWFLDKSAAALLRNK